MHMAAEPSPNDGTTMEDRAGESTSAPGSPYDVKSPRDTKEFLITTRTEKRYALTRQEGKFHLVVGVTGSVAAIKLAPLLRELRTQCGGGRLVIKVVTTQAAMHFFDASDLPNEEIYEDRDEWAAWEKRGDPVLHIELRRWADSLLIAPLDANTLAKIANGLSDNLLTSLVRCWDREKPLFFAPAMNTAMWDHPLTFQHLKTLKETLAYKEIPVIEKRLMCGDEGAGAMAEVKFIASMLASVVRGHFTIYSQS